MWDGWGCQSKKPEASVFTDEFSHVVLLHNNRTWSLQVSHYRSHFVKCITKLKGHDRYSLKMLGYRTQKIFSIFLPKTFKSMPDLYPLFSTSQVAFHNETTGNATVPVVWESHFGLNARPNWWNLLLEAWQNLRYSVLAWQIANKMRDPVGSTEVALLNLLLFI